MSLASNINTLGLFCGIRDVEGLSSQALHVQYGFEQADVMVLFGGSILCGGDVLAQAIRDRVAKRYILVGGAGHTTPELRRRVHTLYPDIFTEALPEAAVFSAYLRKKYGLAADYLETESTNCGNNITYLLDLLDRERVPCRSIILTQDATMQRRMDAGLRKYRPDLTIINYAAYRARAADTASGPRFADPIPGMWSMERYVTLLLGEIPRLTDDPDGYGPNGKGFIAHVDVPEAVRAAFHFLSGRYAVRRANPLFASKPE